MAGAWGLFYQEVYLMKILFIFTGGTIGSTRHKNVISPDGNKSRKLIEEYALRFGIDFRYSVLEPYTELSENNTGEHIKKLALCVLDNLNKDYDGIIVTHGTDTLQYSAAALGYAVGSSSIPVCIVSANRPVEDKKSNALDNLRAAVKFIEKGYGKGVFVPYKNEKDDFTKLHRATRLVASRAFSDEVASIFGSEIGYFDKNFVFHRNDDYKEAADSIPTLDISKLSEASDKILVLPCYVGMSYPALDKNTKYVILSSYHSGTVNTKSQSALDFFSRAKELGIKVYLTGVNTAPKYESATLFETLGIIPLKNISPIASYVKLWLICCNNEAEEKLFESLSGDISAKDYSLTY